jgi:hypothetical protein
MWISKWISKLILMSLATVGCIVAQASQVAGPQTAAPDAFQHLPPMPSQAQAPKPIVARVQALPSRQCAIPLLNVAPDNKAHYAIQTIAPPNEPAGAMIYVNTPPVCDDSGRASNSNSSFFPDVPIKK